MTPRPPKKGKSAPKAGKQVSQVVWGGEERRKPWTGACRRKRQARSVNWVRTGIGLAIVAVAVGLRVTISHGFDAFAIILAVVGAAMVDYEAVKVGSRMFSIRRSNGHTEETRWQSSGE